MLLVFFVYISVNWINLTYHLCTKALQTIASEGALTVSFRGGNFGLKNLKSIIILSN